MDRIWDFCKRAKSGVSPDGLMEGHLPSEEHVDGLTAKVCSGYFVLHAEDYPKNDV